MKRIFTVVATLLTLSLHFWVKSRLYRLHVAGIRSDPCDAVNAAAVFVTSIALLRAATLLISPGTDNREERYGLRSAMAIVLAMLVSLTAECITIIRHLPLPMGQEGTPLLLACEGAVTIFVLWTLTHGVTHRLRSWKQPGMWLIAFCVLFFCPEWPDIASTLWHFVTVAVGLVILLVVVRGALFFFAPEPESEDMPKSNWTEKASAACGTIMLLCGFFAMRDARSMLTLSTIGCLLVTYAFLAGPLHLLPKRQVS